MSNAKNILVTGGAGYIGSHTVVELINNGFTPVILDDFRCAQRNVLKGIEKITGKHVKVCEVDICDLNAVREVVSNMAVSGIVHFAAYKAVGESQVKPIDYYENNLFSLINLLQEMKERNINFLHKMKEAN